MLSIGIGSYFTVNLCAWNYLDNWTELFHPKNEKLLPNLYFCLESDLTYVKIKNQFGMLISYYFVSDGYDHSPVPVSN